jgi:hypothetical protein
MQTAAEIRSDLIEFLRRDLIGPAGGVNEVLEDHPRVRYAAGVLFPKESRPNESAAVGAIEEEEGDVPAPRRAHDAEIIEGAESRPIVTDPPADVPDHDDPVTLANTLRPSAMGISFVLAEANTPLVATAEASVYETSQVPPKDGDERKHLETRWQRVPLDLAPQPIALPPVKQDIRLTDGLRLRVTPRRLTNGSSLVTVTVYNDTKVHSKSSRTFFQVCLSVAAADGGPVFAEYPRTAGTIENDEDLAISLLYRKRRVFAVGHGCAADWSGIFDDRAAVVIAETLPSVLVPPIVPLEGRKPQLSMQFLSSADRTEVVAALHDFCASYRGWIAKRDAEVVGLPHRHQGIARKHLDTCRVASERMSAGVSVLESSKVAFKCFQLMNRAMLMQQVHSRLRRRLNEASKRMHDYVSDAESGKGYWRAFQLAFILMVLPGIVDSGDLVQVGEDEVDSRDLVDLIWFPTGGGKTEAYLGATAFTLFLTRSKEPERNGCRVLMRYTLRLLTSQQFQRAASLICACEMLRREPGNVLGAAPITLGLWVGISLTPNNEDEALRKLARLAKKKGEAENPFQLLSCPWCGTELDNGESLGYIDGGGKQLFVCPNREVCPFSKQSSPLPVCVVDETIYHDPPSLIIGTVDKFAMLAWRDRAGQIFEVGGGPDLIIQDELHLISGPLGSMVGLYETVIDHLCSLHGRRPKIIASTATIRRAAEQCRALYDRPIFQFPPAGLDASDSYFAFEDATSPGRQYVGFLPTASSSPLTAQIRGVVALQQGVALVAAPDTPDTSLDPYWTLVQYFSSLKELGRAATFITADIPEFLPTMHRRYEVPGEVRRYIHMSEELTSRKSEDEIPKILKRLEVEYGAGKKGDEQALDTVLATNMISVGVDIDRLGAMMVVTQPKATSEYIQASSRVGRSKRGPGLVFTLYNAGRPRDRSHYEQFRGYHEAFYGAVEPTSVTPFSPPALDRALHAVLVIAGRHVAKWSSPEEFDADDEAFADFLRFLRARVRSVDEDHLADYDLVLKARLEDWQERDPVRWGDLSHRKPGRVLMRTAGSEPLDEDDESWETPTSLRNVDVACGADVITRYRVHAEVTQ